MVQRIGGNRRKTRKKFSKSPNEKGKLNIRRFMQNFDKGTKVALNIDPAVSGGQYHPRFHGRVAVVRNKKGWCYEVAIMDGRKEKILIVHPSHLKKV